MERLLPVRHCMLRQAGFSILSLLLLVACIAASMAYLLLGAGPNIFGMMSSQKATQLVAQAQFIAHRIAKCATDYPAGNNGTATRSAYPADANPGALPVASLVCPGNQQNLWSGVDGVYLPVSISDFSGWTYTNANGSPLTISISSNQPGTYASAIADAATRLGSAASASASTLTLKVIE